MAKAINWKLRYKEDILNQFDGYSNKEKQHIRKVYNYYLNLQKKKVMKEFDRVCNKWALSDFFITKEFTRDLRKSLNKLFEQK